MVDHRLTRMDCEKRTGSGHCPSQQLMNTTWEQRWKPPKEMVWGLSPTHENALEKEWCHYMWMCTWYPRRWLREASKTRKISQGRMNFDLYTGIGWNQIWRWPGFDEEITFGWAWLKTNASIWMNDSRIELLIVGVPTRHQEPRFWSIDGFVDNL